MSSIHTLEDEGPDYPIGDPFTPEQKADMLKTALDSNVKHAKRFLEENGFIVSTTASPAEKQCDHPGPQWQTIETAPKDGTWVWAFYPRQYRHFDQYAVARWLETPGNEPMWWDNAEHRDDEQPTHWMPLPSPPTSGDRTETAEQKPVGETNSALSESKE